MVQGYEFQTDKQLIGSQNGGLGVATDMDSLAVPGQKMAPSIAPAGNTSSGASTASSRGNQMQE